MGFIDFHVPFLFFFSINRWFFEWYSLFGGGAGCVQAGFSAQPWTRFLPDRSKSSYWSTGEPGRSQPSRPILSIIVLHSFLLLFCPCFCVSNCLYFNFSVSKRPCRYRKIWKSAFLRSLKINPGSTPQYDCGMLPRILSALKIYPLTNRKKKVQ